MNIIGIGIVFSSIVFIVFSAPLQSISDFPGIEYQLPMFGSPFEDMSKFAMIQGPVLAARQPLVTQYFYRPALFESPWQSFPDEPREMIYLPASAVHSNQPPFSQSSMPNYVYGTRNYVYPRKSYVESNHGYDQRNYGYANRHQYQQF